MNTLLSTDTDEIVALAPAPDSDGELLDRFRTGCEDAADRLYERYAGRLRRLAERYCKNGYARRFDADDIVQSVFRIFFQGVRTQGYDAPPDGEIWGLLTVLALNKVRGNIDHHQAAKRSVERTCAMPEEAAAAPVATDQTAVALLKMVLDEQLEAYPEHYREIVRLRMEGYEVGEISNISKRSSRTVERILLEFRKKLAENA
jgi:RNA polymerase sigma-70 factor, ECF subfamily